jgi:hypothetical protein
MNMYVGVDLGQRVDYAAVTAVCRTLALNPATGWPMRDSFGLLRYGWRIKGLYRLPLRTSYEDVAAYVAILAGWSALKNASVILDGTGVGIAAAETIRGAVAVRAPDAEVWAISLTSGEGWRITSRGQINASKVQVVSTLAAALEGGRLRMCRKPDGSLPRQTDLLINELRAFKQRQTQAGNTQTGASSGQHDDAVLSLSMPLWFGSQRFGRMEERGPHLLAWEREALDLESSGDERPLPDWRPPEQSGSLDVDDPFAMTAASSGTEPDIYDERLWE